MAGNSRPEAEVGKRKGESAEPAGPEKTEEIA